MAEELMKTELKIPNHIPFLNLIGWPVSYTFVEDMYCEFWRCVELGQVFQTAQCSPHGQGALDICYAAGSAPPQEILTAVANFPGLTMQSGKLPVKTKEEADMIVHRVRHKY